MLSYCQRWVIVGLFVLRNQVQLNLLLVLHRLAEESRIKAFEEKTATIKVHHVKAVAKVSSLVLLIVLFQTEICATKCRKSLIISDPVIYHIIYSSLCSSPIDSVFIAFVPLLMIYNWSIVFILFLIVCKRFQNCLTSAAWQCNIGETSVPSVQWLFKNVLRWVGVRP